MVRNNEAVGYYLGGRLCFMEETYSHRFERLIGDHTGLKLRPRQRDLLRATLSARISALKLGHADEYHRLLQGGDAAAQAEWKRIVGPLTNQESYFFRDTGQMALLRDRILPQLIERNAAARSLRLWSAGCSTGEEAYTLAMLVAGLLPKAGRPWDVRVLGTDIDEQALQDARRGVYGPWSFRMVDPAARQRLFRRTEEGWQVGESSRSLVTFGRCNLVADAFPGTAPGIHEMDLILCRNVFIYFESEAVTRVLGKFARTLREGGYLMTGHVETHGRMVAQLETCTFPESEIYRRSTATSIPIDRPPAPVKEAGRRSPSPRRRPVAAPTGRLGDSDPMAKARALADLGRYGEAIASCLRLIEELPFASEPYELLASIAQEQGRHDEAKSLLKKALYLAPASPHVYMELGALYRREGDPARARKMNATALELLQRGPPEAIVGPSRTSAQECILHLLDGSTE